MKNLLRKIKQNHAQLIVLSYKQKKNYNTYQNKKKCKQIKSTTILVVYLYCEEKTHLLLLNSQFHHHQFLQQYLYLLL